MPRICNDRWIRLLQPNRRPLPVRLPCRSSIQRSLLRASPARAPVGLTSSTAIWPPKVSHQPPHRSPSKRPLDGSLGVQVSGLKPRHRDDPLSSWIRPLVFQCSIPPRDCLPSCHQPPPPFPCLPRKPPS